MFEPLVSARWGRLRIRGPISPSVTGFDSSQGIGLRSGGEGSEKRQTHAIAFTPVKLRQTAIKAPTTVKLTAVFRSAKGCS
jgi:hypothetical protein